MSEGLVGAHIFWIKDSVAVINLLAGAAGNLVAACNPRNLHSKEIKGIFCTASTDTAQYVVSNLLLTGTARVGGIRGRWHFV